MQYLAYNSQFSWMNDRLSNCIFYHSLSFSLWFCHTVSSCFSCSYLRAFALAELPTRNLSLIFLQVSTLISLFKDPFLITLTKELHTPDSPSFLYLVLFPLAAGIILWYSLCHLFFTCWLPDSFSAEGQLGEGRRALAGWVIAIFLVFRAMPVKY